MHAAVRVLLSIMVVACFWGCSSLNQGPTGDRNLISPDEIQTSDARNAYELIHRLRPLWLQSRGERSLRLQTTVVVYQDGAMLGGIETLEGIPIEIVRSVQALDAAEAGRLPGLGSRHVERAIMISTR